MDVLSGRKIGGIIEGDIRIGGYSKVQKTFARVSGYCEQNDIHSPYIIVDESVRYSAWLQLPSKIDSATKGKFVEEVLETIELDDIKDNLVGIAGQIGLSTEQRKRLTIAVELVSNPSIIFMDVTAYSYFMCRTRFDYRRLKSVVEMGTSSGGAPKARVTSNKLCWPTLGEAIGGCYEANILAGFEAAIDDGVYTYLLYKFMNVTACSYFESIQDYVENSVFNAYS